METGGGFGWKILVMVALLTAGMGGALDAEATNCALAITDWEEYCCVGKVDEWSGTVKCTLTGVAKQENIDEELETVWDVGDPFTNEAESESGDETELYLDLGLESGTTTGEYTADVTFKGYYTPSGDLVCEASNQVEVTVVDVESILPDIGQEVDDGDGNDSTKVFVVSVTNTNDITVTATLNPTVAESDLPSGWTINGGSGSGKLERTVDADSASKTIFTFSFGGSDSGLETTVYVYEASLSLYSDEGDGSSGGSSASSFGHSWWEIETDTDIKEFSQSLDAEGDQEDKYFGVAGYWPKNVDMWPSSDLGEVRFGGQNSDGSDRTATASGTWSIKWDELQLLLDNIEILKESRTDTWYLLNNNCADQAIYRGEEGGISPLMDDSDDSGVTKPSNFADWLKNNAP